MTPDEATAVEATPSAPERRRTPRRTQIALAAAKVFAEHSYHTVGMREVAAAVGIRGASLYNHFSSKEEILYEIALSVTQGTVDGYISVLDDPGRPAERLSALVRGHIVWCVSRRVEHLVSVAEVKELTPEHRRRVLEYKTYYHRRVRDVISAGQRQGQFDVPDARLATNALLDMLNGVSGWYRPEMDVEQLIDAYVRLGIGGMLGYDGDLDALCSAAREIITSSGVVLAGDDDAVIDPS